MKKPAASPLQKITVHVEEARGGTFRWILGDLQHSSEWELLERGKSLFETYHEAMADGLLALQSRVSDLKLGPRGESPRDGRATAASVADAPDAPDDETSTDEEAPSDALNPKADEPSGEPADKPPRRRTVFGFGLIS